MKHNQNYDPPKTGEKIHKTTTLMNFKHSCFLAHAHDSEIQPLFAPPVPDHVFPQKTTKFYNIITIEVFKLFFLTSGNNRVT